MKYKYIIDFIKDIFKTDDFIPLHSPVFCGNEKQYVLDTINSTFVSSVGKFVDNAEDKIKEITGAKFAIATVNGTSALHISLLLIGATSDTEIITQPLTFIATCNAIKYTGASPIFIDVDLDTMGLSPKKLKEFLDENAFLKNGECFNKKTGKKIVACVPMHTFGFPCRIDEIKEICDNHFIKVVEDAAESLGSFYDNKHTGTFGEIGIFSFNGNKIVTSGGGGMIVTDNEQLAQKAKHITTTAKLPHKWEYKHDEIGYNYRMPNLNAALLCAQLEQLTNFIVNKRELADQYASFFKEISDIDFFSEQSISKSNYWLNTLIFKNKFDRDLFLEYSNSNGVMTRPIWCLMNNLKMFENHECHDLINSIFLQDRVVNIPSGVRILLD